MIYYEEPDRVIYQGHALDVLMGMPPESVDCVITSPPYWGLRTYKTEPQIWGDNHCEHDFIQYDRPNGGGHPSESAQVGAAKVDVQRIYGYKAAFCLKCNAWRGELGLEPTIELYISHLLQIFDEVKRVLKKTGTCWVNIGDSYASGTRRTNKSQTIAGGNEQDLPLDYSPSRNMPDYPAKSLCLIPERFALGMVERGWILRNNIIWYKANPMPESVKDRFTGTYEYLFFFCRARERSSDVKEWLPERMKADNAAWLAAIVDGEGTISINRLPKDKVSGHHDSFVAFVSVGNSCQRLIEKCYELTGVGTISKSNPQDEGHGFDMWQWRVGSHKAVGVIAEIYPYLIAKREQAKVAIALQKTNKNRGSPKGQSGGSAFLTDAEYKAKVKLWELVKALNRRDEASSVLPEPNLNRHSGCEDYWFEQQFEPNQNDGIWGAQGEHKYDQAEGQGRHGAGSIFPPMSFDERQKYLAGGRNKRDVWEINTEPYPEAHFATFPEKLVETPILAGCPSAICKKCGKAREHIYEYRRIPQTSKRNDAGDETFRNFEGERWDTETTDKGYTDCGCNAGFEAGVVLDPFAGSGATGAVAKRFARKFIGIELSEKYCKLHKKRLQGIPLPMELV